MFDGKTGFGAQQSFRQDARSRGMIQARLLRLLIAAICAGIGIGMMVTLAHISAVPLATIPFATSIVLVSGAPSSPPASTKAIIFGHLICAAAGIIMHDSGFEYTVTVAAAVGVSVALMLAFNVFHPPAGITPLVLYGSTFDWTFMIMPVLVGAVSVAILARTAEKLFGLIDRLAAREMAGQETPGDQGAHR